MQINTSVLVKSLVIFLVLNAFFYFFVTNFSDKVPFNKYNYLYNAHHFLQDNRVHGKDENLLRALGQFDAQWYLKIASDGYSLNTSNRDLNNKATMEGLTYGFFPLYPISIHFLNIAVKNTEISAFLLSNILICLNFLSLIFVVSKLFNQKVAIKCAFLLLLFPFGIFFRSYYAENLFLLLLIWFSYFFLQNKYVLAGLLLGLINVARGNAYFVDILFASFLTKDLFKRKINFLRYVFTLSLICLPFFIWIYFNFIRTGNGLYFFGNQSQWFAADNIFSPLLNNLNALLSVFHLPFHTFHNSKVDVLTTFIFGILIWRSKKVLPKKLWLVSLLIWLLPLLVKDTMSLSRYQGVNFPVFVYLATKLNDKSFVVVSSIFYLALLLVGIYFINWYWVG